MLVYGPACAWFNKCDSFVEMIILAVIFNKAKHAIPAPLYCADFDTSVIPVWVLTLNPAYSF